MVHAAAVDEEVGEVSLSDYAGKYVILFWYPKDFTYVCPRCALPLAYALLPGCRPCVAVDVLPGRTGGRAALALPHAPLLGKGPR